MSGTDSSTQNGGIGFAGLLGIVFIVLKLTHVIAWPWPWVLAPLWIPLAVVLVVFAVIVLVAVVKDWLDSKDSP